MNYNWKTPNQCLVVNVHDETDLQVLKELSNGHLLSIKYTEQELALIIDNLNELLEDKDPRGVIVKDNKL